MAVAEDVEQDLTSCGLEGVVQLATFHPAYQFADRGPDDVENSTNRSPWPLFHLLRERDVTSALQSQPGVPDATADRICRRNEETMRRLGEGQAHLAGGSPPK